jgi:hypothetical protein
VNRRWLVRAALVVASFVAGMQHAAAQVVTRDSASADDLPVDKGLLSLSSATVTLNDGKLQIVFIPLDERILRLITKDSYRSMEHQVRAGAADAELSRTTDSPDRLDPALAGIRQSTGGRQAASAGAVHLPA